MSGRVPGPWTQSIHVGWRPELNFYDHRTRVLRGFEEQGTLRAFHFSENEVAAQLFESRDRLAVWQGGLTLDMDDPKADLERAWGAVEQAFTAIEPGYPRTVHASFRHLVPLNLPFAEAVARGYGTTMGKLGTPAIRCGDWAILVDLSLNGDPAAEGQLEFGVVTREEAPRRLSGVIRGRVQRGETYPGVPDDPAAYPEVGLFTNFWMGRNMRTGTAFLQEAREFWGYARQEADKLVGSLQAMFIGAENEEKSTG